MRSNIRVFVANPQDLNEAESQVYTNYNNLPVDEVLTTLSKGKVLAPEVGNFPHMGGSGSPVTITGIVATLSEDNAGMDITRVIENVKDWGGG